MQYTQGKKKIINKEHYKHIHKAKENNKKDVIHKMMKVIFKQMINIEEE